MLSFDVERHEYAWRGRTVPNVTTVLEAAGLYDFGGVPRERLEFGRDRGRKIHKLCELDDRGDLDPESVDESLAGYLEAWRRFKRECVFKHDAIEERVYHPNFEYAGTLDRRGWLAINPALLDIKHGEPQRATGPQTAAYLEAALAAELVPRAWRCGRYAVHLQADGRYHLVRYRALNDFAAFTAALTLYNWRRQ